jgi:hypothetical protein
MLDLLSSQQRTSCECHNSTWRWAQNEEREMHGAQSRSSKRAAGTGAWTVLGRAVLQKKSARLIIGRCTNGPSAAAMITSPPNDWLWRYWLGDIIIVVPIGLHPRGFTVLPLSLTGTLTRHPQGSTGVDTAACGYPRPWRGEALAG